MATSRATSERTDHPEPFLLGRSDAARRLRQQVQRIARTPGTTVLVSGEPGMEARALARSLHARAGGRPERFVVAGPEWLIETRAEPPAPATPPPEPATLFLEEVGALAPEAQAALLAWFDDPTPGAPRVRVVASASADLDEAAERGSFLPDLLYRLNVLVLALPPLRERREDLPEIADALLAALRARHGGACTLAADAHEALRSHDWPGNGSELEHVLGLATLRAGDEAVDAAALAELGVGAPDRIPSMPAAGSLRELEESAIRRALASERGNRSGAARALGIHRQTLYNKMRLYGIS